MKPKRDLLIGVTFLVLLAALAVGQKVLESRAVAEAAGVRAIRTPVPSPKANSRRPAEAGSAPGLGEKC